MIIHHFSSEDFRPKRLVFGNGGAAPSSNPFEPLAIPPPDSTNPPAPKRKAPETRIYDAPKRVQEAVRGKIEAAEQINGLAKRMAESVQVGTRANWSVLNRQFGEVMDIGMPNVSPDQKVRALQRVVFTELGLIDENGRPKDPAAVIDGKLGPYTLAALARHAKLPAADIPPVPNAEQNRALAASMVAYRESPESTATTETKAPEAVDLQGEGRKFLTDLSTSIEQSDGSIVTRTGEGESTKDVYYKFVDGRWKSANYDQYMTGDWQEIGKEGGAGEADVVSSELKRYQDEVIAYEASKVPNSEPVEEPGGGVSPVVTSGVESMDTYDAEYNGVAKPLLSERAKLQRIANASIGMQLEGENFPNGVTQRAKIEAQNRVRAIDQELRGAEKKRDEKAARLEASRKSVDELNEIIRKLEMDRANAQRVAYRSNNAYSTVNPSDVADAEVKRIDAEREMYRAVRDEKKAAEASFVGPRQEDATPASPTEVIDADNPPKDLAQLQGWYQEYRNPYGREPIPSSTMDVGDLEDYYVTQPSKKPTA